jgi:putative phosphoserine phosphatase/1-acylglycerol-3-phosphate O-acyltransferase
VIPIGLWGTERVWPRSARVPNVLNVLDRPKVSASVGPPVTLKHKSLDADTKRIMKAIAKQLPSEAKLPRHPSPDELAATYPPGYKGDPRKENSRRPGRD